MSDEAWMPSDEEIYMARTATTINGRTIVESLELIRAMIRTAAERALAEERKRHEREVIEARIEEVGAFSCESAWCGIPGHRECFRCAGLTHLRAKLAALDQEPKP